MPQFSNSAVRRSSIAAATARGRKTGMPQKHGTPPGQPRTKPQGGTGRGTGHSKEQNFRNLAGEGRKGEIALKKTFFLLWILILISGTVPAFAEQSPFQDGLMSNPFLPVSSAESTYTILVRSAGDFAPVPGTMVQFCSDTQCMVGRTDAGGSASFEAEPGNYTVHILKAPEGYEETAEEIALTAENRTAAFTLQKASTAQPGDALSNAAPTGKTADTWDFPLSGFSLKLPASFRRARGQLLSFDCGETQSGSEIYLAGIIYIARTDEEHEAFERMIQAAGEEMTPEVTAASDEYDDGRSTVLAYLVCAGKEQSIGQIIKEELNAIASKDVSLIGETDRYSYYLIVPDYTAYAETLLNAFGDALYEEFSALYQDMRPIRTGITVKDPTTPVSGAEPGSQVPFGKTDPDGIPGIGDSLLIVKERTE